MSEGAIVSIAVLLGWLLLAGSAMASFQLGWSKIAQIALVRLAIFVCLFLVADFFGATLPN